MTTSHRLRRIVLACTAAAGPIGWASPAMAEAAADMAADAALADAPAIIVYGRPDGYDIEKTPTGTKTDTPLVDVPQTISVISREQLDDQGVLSLNDALRYVPGVVLGQGEGHRDQVTLRGQNSTADFFLDGIRDDAQYYRPLYNVERVEVLKGANAMIFGRGGGGGVINRVSKAPEYDSLNGSAAAGADTFGAWNVALDLGAPLADGVGLRFNATYEAFDNHRQQFGGHFFGVTPTLGARLGDDTTFTATYEYAEDRRTTDRGVPSRGGRPLTGYDGTFFGSVTANPSEVTAHLAHGRIDHRFSDSLSANLTLHYGWYDKFYSNVYPNGAVSGANTVTLAAYNSATRRENLIGQGNLVWKGSTGSLGHTVLLGFEAGDQSTFNARRNGVFAGSPTVTLAETIVVPGVSFPVISTSSQSDASFWAVYLQDQIDIGDAVKIVGGLRYDEFEISSTNLASGFAGRRGDGKWSPRVGLILKPRENLSVYGSYAISFLPQSGDQFAVLDATTQALAPERFENIEAGVKWDVTGALAFTAAVYRLDRTNTRATDPVTGNAVLTGSSRTKGIELSLVGRVTDDLDVSLGYTLQDGEVTATTTAAPAGRKLSQLPRHQLSAWGRYNFTDRFGFGLGVIHQSSQFATISNAVVMPAFTRFDAAFYYDASDTVTLQVNVENLTDTGYFPSAHTDNNISVGEPLNAKVTLRLKF
ncbi:MAG: TonB-dependent siderophore receptor [Sphingomonadaceae bacterium]|nr:TonB-dependent siderophore receptor [Sphingomonadaceae bacterium]